MKKKNYLHDEMLLKQAQKPIRGKTWQGKRKT